MCRIPLTFNRVLKELIWCVNSRLNPPGLYAYPSLAKIQYTNDVLDAHKMRSHVNYYGESPVQGAELVINGQARFAEQDGLYFDSVQPRLHHSSTPEYPGIHVYSMALRPEDPIQASGFLNFSRADHCELNVHLKDYQENATVGKYYDGAHIDVWGVGGNQLLIRAGMAALVYKS